MDYKQNGSVGHLFLFEKARMMATADGRLRYIWGDKLHLKPERTGNFVCVGAEDWALVKDHIWSHRNYEAQP